MKIRNIIFDLGGVLLNLDHSKTIEAFKKLGLGNVDEIYSQANQTDFFDRFEKGKISADEFIQSLKRYFPENISSHQLIAAWNAMLLDFPKVKLKLLEVLKEKYDTILLSNTNVIHIESFENTLKQNNGIENLESYFKKVYYSSSIGMRKPDLEIFEFVCRQERFVPDETLFIDDSMQHINGAKQMGIRTYHFTPGEDLEVALSTYLS